MVQRWWQFSSRWSGRRGAATRRLPPWLLALPLGLGLGLGSLAPAPARALVPYVYVPPSQELEGAGLGIAQAAGRLLRLGQAEDAARLAALTVQLLPMIRAAGCCWRRRSCAATSWKRPPKPW